MDRQTWTDVDDYITRTVVAPDPSLDATREATTAAGLPEIAVTPPQGKFLEVLARGSGASAILEIGTLAGYSTICLARGLRPGGRVISLEIDPKHAEIATRNIAGAGLADAVEIRVAPASESLANLIASGAGPFDLIFIDADKPSTPAYFDRALELSRVGTLIIVDNVVRKGGLADTSSEDPSIQGVRELHERVARNRRVRATTIQTVGSKGHDGFLIAAVVE